MTIVELPSTELIDASATAEWYVPADWTPPAMLTAELPALRLQPRHPNIALAVLFAAIAGSIVIVAFAATIALAGRDAPKETIVVAPPAHANLPANVPAKASLPTPSKPAIPSIDVNDLPRAKRKK